MLTIALAKGRLLKSFIAYLASINQNELVEQLESRERQLQIKTENYHFLFVKGKDVPIYVEQGIADIGITGGDILSENQYDVNQLLALPFGQCHLSVASFDSTQTYKTIATSFPNMAQDYFKSTGRDITCIELSGSIELACVIGMVDGIVDIVQTGTTLRSNGLIEKEHIRDIQAQLITNRQSFFTQSSAIDAFIQMLGVSKIDL
ncbi:ATP phosphoribosyltransferase [Staphylococcus felis]|uniref:ATP phosphoribosyltransferase n=1 Tax=Staphylococcus felis TaxID=46127 RepID=UPI000CD07CD0|nr:ATP phosphoribosyltransferase [Staphylococcus felis]AVP36215.1 ATP phosphoribosyltransferase [Staphylococcus felis]PNZ35402.1 ATP phosphoribosyltransferase [Staphylococcus felis]QQB03817.1 ATP phosphoribosyltransferase [Staphylococcus felis]REH79684.1 ATP phosphoribosyltransferase [Staphylococcus felis]REI09995.1 ATP phosphoribosyltransferase [Staphylococcus felis]